MILLAKKLDAPAFAGRFNTPPLCSYLLVTHLTFEDYVLVFFDVLNCYLAAILDVFTDFFKAYGLRINLQSYQSFSMVITY